MNPARSFGPSVVSGSFPGYHWIYWIGPLIGSLLATFIYSLLKTFDYGSVVLGQDADSENKAPAPVPLHARIWHASMGFTRHQREAMLASGMKPHDIERAEAGMVAGAQLGGDSYGPDVHTSQPSSDSRDSDATLGPTARGPNGEVKNEQTGRTDGEEPVPSIMNAHLQGRGGIGAPGAHKSGLANFDRFRHPYKG